MGSFRFGKEERWEVSLAYASWELQGEMLREGNAVKSLSRDLIQDVSIQKQRGETRWAKIKHLKPKKKKSPKSTQAPKSQHPKTKEIKQSSNINK